MLCPDYLSRPDGCRQGCHIPRPRSNEVGGPEPTRRSTRNLLLPLIIVGNVCVNWNTHTHTHTHTEGGRGGGSAHRAQEGGIHIGWYLAFFDVLMIDLFLLPLLPLLRPPSWRPTHCSIVSVRGNIYINITRKHGRVWRLRVDLTWPLSDLFTCHSRFWIHYEGRYAFNCLCRLSALVNVNSFKCARLFKVARSPFKSNITPMPSLIDVLSINSII